MSSVQTSAFQSVAEQVKSLGPWFHNLHLPDGTQTCPDHWLGDFPTWKWRELEHAIPQDLAGWSCLDIGCNAGFYSFEMAKRGATVLGIDLDDRYLAQARWAAGQLGFADRVTFRNMQVYDLARLEQDFDLVWFMGVLYHLRYPMLGLDIVTRKVKRLLVFQTLTFPGEERVTETWGKNFGEQDQMRDAGWPKMAFLEHGFAGDPTNWWMMNKACCEATLRACGLRVVHQPADATYVCEPNPDRPSAMTTWNEAEYLAATGLGASAPPRRD